MRLRSNFVSLCVLASLAACGGGGGGSTTPTPAPNPGFNTGVNITGPWKIVATTTESTGDTSFAFSNGDSPCDPVGNVDTSDVTLTQTGTSLKVVDPDDNKGSNTSISARAVTFQVTDEKEGVRGTVDSTWTFAADGNSMTGTQTQTLVRVSDGMTVCTEKMTVTGSRGTSGGGGATPINVVGTFNGTEQVTQSTGAPCDELEATPESDTWTITQNGTTVTWDASEDGSMISGTLTGREFSGTRTATVDGVTWTAVRTVTFSEDGSSFSGTTAWTRSTAPNCNYTDTIMGTRSASGGGGQSGSLIVKLSWAGPDQADLDLGVTEPSGTLVNLDVASTIGGVFSGDVECGDMVASPEESWTYASAPAGSWSAVVRFSEFCGTQSQPFPFTVSIQKPSESMPTLTQGTIPAGGQMENQTFPFSF